MSEDNGFLEWAFKGIVGGIFLVGGYMWKGLVDEMRALTKAQTDHELLVERDFAKKDALKMAYDNLNTAIADVRDDIKDLIRAVAGNNHGG